MFFAATGVSDGDLLRGVRYFSGGASTNSIVMRASSGTGKCLPALTSARAVTSGPHGNPYPYHTLSGLLHMPVAWLVECLTRTSLYGQSMSALTPIIFLSHSLPSLSWQEAETCVIVV